MRGPVLSPVRESHLHECGHTDDCFLSRGDAAGSDCRECRARKFNRKAAERASAAASKSD